MLLKKIELRLKDFVDWVILTKIKLQSQITAIWSQNTIFLTSPNASKNSVLVRKLAKKNFLRPTGWVFFSSPGGLQTKNFFGFAQWQCPLRLCRPARKSGALVGRSNCTFWRSKVGHASLFCAQFTPEISASGSFGRYFGEKMRPKMSGAAVVGRFR